MALTDKSGQPLGYARNQRGFAHEIDEGDRVVLGGQMISADQKRHLMAIAKREQRSMAQLVREGMQMYLDQRAN